jgi:hypothetical protein
VVADGGKLRTNKSEAQNRLDSGTMRDWRNSASGADRATFIRNATFSWAAHVFSSCHSRYPLGPRRSIHSNALDGWVRTVR